MFKNKTIFIFVENPIGTLDIISVYRYRRTISPILPVKIRFPLKKKNFLLTSKNFISPVIGFISQSYGLPLKLKTHLYNFPSF